MALDLNLCKNNQTISFPSCKETKLDSGESFSILPFKVNGKIFFSFPKMATLALQAKIFEIDLPHFENVSEGFTR